MIDPIKLEAIKETLTILQTKENSTLFAILDGALIKNLEHTLSELMIKGQYVSLYADTKYAKFNKVAPYLIKLNTTDKMFEWWLNNGWNKHWGILCTSNRDLRTLESHFKNLLTVTDLNNKEILFRFYDPRVLSIFMKNCNTENYLEMSDFVNHYCLENGNNEFIVVPQRDVKRTKKSSEIKQPEAKDYEEIELNFD